MNLTEKIIEREQPPPLAKGDGHSQKFLWDSKERGLAVRILDTGTRTFIFQMRFDGKVERRKIGRYGDWTLAQARVKAAELRVAFAHGEEPTNDKATFGALCELFFKHAEVQGRKSVAQMRKQIDQHVPQHWLSHKASAITKNDVAELHDKIGAQHRSAANHLVALIQAIINFAIKRDLFKGANPARGCDKFKETKREQYLTYEELARLNEALMQEPDWRHRAYFPLLLLTGARKSEWLGARWENIDLAQGLWFKPVTKTESQTALLPAPAIAILEPLPSRGKSKWVFPGYGKAGHLKDAYEAWNRIRDRAKIPDLRQHDLRHSFASFLADKGVSIQVISKLLNHKSIQTTQRYSHIRDDAQRKAIEANAALMIANGK